MKKSSLLLTATQCELFRKRYVPILSIILPVYNEASRLEATLKAWSEIVPKVGGELWAIDDGSKDTSLEILRKWENRSPWLKVWTQENSGHGPTILKGYEIALQQQVAYIFQADSDSPVPPAEFLKLWELRTHSVFILGQRHEGARRWHRKAMSWGAKTLISWLFNSKVVDPNCPFRLMSREFLKQVLPNIPKNTFAPNLLITALARNRVLTISVASETKESVTVLLNDWRWVGISYRCLKELFRLRIAKRKSTYPSQTEENRRKAG